ncbi:hypothetical protein SSX86_003773 [Deinandra increscens subsp. villosa]|uniref:Phloem protein 2-like protein n=1 Tax=Deinandra increscens subsp. villosa TaxID=3103831 RepID=A0AAP0HA97_9ASTR
MDIQWFSINQKGEHCEMISFAECLDSSAPSKFGRWSSAYDSRFVVGSYYIDSYNESEWSSKTRVKTQFLSPGVTYTVNLVFKFIFPSEVRFHDLLSLKYKLQGEAKTSISFIACERDDGWWMCELCQLTSDHRIVDLEILFEGLGYILAEGIEFRPLEKVEHKDDERQPIIDSDANWEEKLPSDYEDIMKWSTISVQWTTKKEAYSIICKGLLINDGQTFGDTLDHPAKIFLKPATKHDDTSPIRLKRQPDRLTCHSSWLSLDQNGKKSHMLSTRAVRISSMYDDEESGYILSSPESRFGEVVHWVSWTLNIYTEIQSQLLSSETTYASYLVYKIQKHQSIFEAPLEVKIDLFSDNRWYVYLVSPQTPVIRPKVDQNTHNPVNRPRIKGIPQRRNDGWMEVQIWEFQTAVTTEMIPMHIKLRASGGKDLSGLIIEGFEFRPI